MGAADGEAVGRVAARTALLDGQQVELTVGTLTRDRVVAALAVDGIGRGELAAGLADVEQLGGGAGGRAAALVYRPFAQKGIAGIGP